MIDLEADVNYQDSDGNTALHYLIQASIDRQSNVLEYAKARSYLWFAGAKTNIPNNKKITAANILSGKNINDVAKGPRSARWW